MLFGRRGVIGRWLDSLGIQLVFTWQGAVIASMVVAFPLVLKSARAAFESIDPQLERAARTLGVTFKAGVPLVEALDSVANATGSVVYNDAVKRIREDVAVGHQLQLAMRQTSLFPNMVVQMIAIGEEAGALDAMLFKIAEFYETEVNNAVEILASEFRVEYPLVGSPQVRGPNVGPYVLPDDATVRIFDRGGAEHGGEPLAGAGEPVLAARQDEAGRLAPADEAFAVPDPGQGLGVGEARQEVFVR